MRILPFMKKPLLPVCALAVSLCFGVQSLRGRPAAPQQPSTGVDTRVEDVELRTGPFAIAGQNYTVVLHEKRLAGVSDPALAQTLAGLDIADAGGNFAYRKVFSFAIEQGRFSRILTASVEPAAGKTGAGLVIHYREPATPSQNGAAQVAESWQVFGLVNGKLAPLGKPTPIGGGTTGGPYMGVVMKAVNGSVSVISQPDTFELRAWTGYFYVIVPLRVDWSHGGLAEGQRCVEMFGGRLLDVGCDMRVEAARKPPSDEFTFARLFVEAKENFGSAEHVVIGKDSKVEILGSSAITTWNENGDLIQPVFSDLWLHMRFDDRTGWIHGQEDFAAVGLPAGSPAP
jgi:hypothetical protein